MSSSLFPSDFLTALAAWSQGRAREGWGQGASMSLGRERLGFERRPWQVHEGRKAIDWRASARRGELLVRQREREIGGELQLVLDRSASIQPGTTRRDADQRRIALIWGWLHLESGGSLRLLTSSFNAVYSGGSARQALIQTLSELPEPAGNEMPRFGASQETLLLSDPWFNFSCPIPTQTTLVALILPEEDQPPEGGLQLRDVESGEKFKATVSSREYQVSWEHYLQQKRVECHNKGAAFQEYRLPAPEATALTLLKQFKGAGLV